MVLHPEEQINTYDYESYLEAKARNPFAGVIQKYDTGGKQLTDEALDDLYLDVKRMETAGSMKYLFNTLDEQAPEYSILLRWDPSSVSYHQPETARAPRFCKGASVSYARLFHELSKDNFHIERLENEVVWVIDQPSLLVNPHGGVVTSYEPTVIFTSRQFEHQSNQPGSSFMPDIQDEETLFGMTFSHGHNRPFYAFPHDNRGITSPTVAHAFTTPDFISRAEQLPQTTEPPEIPDHVILGYD